MRKAHWRLAGLLAAAALLVFVVAGIFLAGSGPTPLPSNSQPIVLRGGHAASNRLDSKSWSFDYERAQMSADESKAEIDGIHSGVLYKDGKPYLRIAARHISANTVSFDFVATGDVHIEQIGAPSGARSFDTDLVQWNNTTKLLTLAHPSIIRTGDQTLRVSSIVVDFGKSLIRLGRIEGSVQN